MSEPNEPILRPDSAGSSAGEPKKEDTAGWAGDLFTWLQALTFALVIIMIVFTFFARIIGVDGHSMEPTLQDRDMLLLQCAGYEPRQGDVVVLHKSFSTTGEPIVKRVIAVGGQSVHIDYDTSTVYVDGEPVDDSSDSREESLGPVENQYVLGRALVVLFPFSHFGSIH